MRYLAEAGLLPQIHSISAVSGGAILAAVIADRWPQIATGGFTAEAFVESVEMPLRSAIAKFNFRNKGMRRWAVQRAMLRGPARGATVIQTMIEHLCQSDRVVELDPALQVLLTSTDLATGNAFRITREFVGSYSYGYVPTPPDLSLWKAVAASAAVPGLFTPVQLMTAGTGLTNAPPVLSLTDGGVYDNLGLEWFQGWDPRRRPTQARSVDFLAVIDSSGELTSHARRYRSVRALLRTRDVQYWMSRATRVRWLVDQLTSGSIQGVLIGIRADPRTTTMPDGTRYPPLTYDAALPTSLVRPLSKVRTDLDRFSMEESGLLAYHGYWLCHARLTNLHPRLAVQSPKWRTYEGLTPDTEQRLGRLITGGSRRRLLR